MVVVSRSRHEGLDGERGSTGLLGLSEPRSRAPPPRRLATIRERIALAHSSAKLWVAVNERATVEIRATKAIVKQA